MSPVCNTEGEAFWKHNGWVQRGDLQVLEKPLAAAPVEGGGC